jgi:hypothetical protein
VRLWHGDAKTLQPAAQVLADTLGVPTDYGGDWIHRHIAKRIIEQYGKYREVFDAALAKERWTLALETAAEEQEIHLYTLVYGIPQYVIDAVDIQTPEQLMCVIQIGDMERHVLAQLVLRNEKQPLGPNKFGLGKFTGVPSAYAARSVLAQYVMGTPFAYAMMRGGATLEDIMLERHSGALTSCMVLGVPPGYASALLQRDIDPHIIADAYHSGIAPEYVSVAL